MRTEGKAPSSNDPLEEVIKDLKQSRYKVTEEYDNTGHRSKISGESPTKTPRDWLQILVQLLTALALPITLFVGTQWFAGQQNLANQQITTDQQQETTLKTYLDNMSDLLLNHGLRLSKPGDEVRLVARERTLTTFRRLDAPRNRIVVQFLQDANLLAGKNAIIDLTVADLENDDLSGANLIKVNFSAFDPGQSAGQGGVEPPSGANLSGANLSGANLAAANLDGANLSRANLSGADLDRASLRQADLQRANLSRANLQEADFSALTTFTDLRGANLSGANIYQTNLGGANLSGTIMPDGSKHP